MTQPPRDASRRRLAHIGSAFCYRLAIVHAYPTALTIGGLDPSSGAGITADLRAMRLAGAWGCAVCSTLTVQSSRGLQSAHPVAAGLLGKQLDCLLADVPVSAIKTGALGSAENVQTVLERTRTRASIPLIVDPVMWPSRGKRLNLSGNRAVQAMRELGAGATLLTPNLAEAEAMLQATIDDATQAKEAAVALLELGAHAVLLKGGHSTSGAEEPRVVDWLATASMVRPLSRKRIELPREVRSSPDDWRFPKPRPTLLMPLFSK